MVCQAGNLAFNKAKLMNIGYLEAMKDDRYDCVVFHDVDLLLEDDRLLYTCVNTPKHLSVAIDKYGYKYLDELFFIGFRYYFKFLLIFNLNGNILNGVFIIYFPPV